MYFIGLDIGTSSICGVLMNASSKEVLQAVTKVNHAALPSRHTWEFVQDPALMLRSIQDIMAELSPLGSRISGVGVTGQMHGILYVDREGQAVSPLYTWQDKRGDLPFPDGDLTYAEHLSRLTGYPLATGYGMVTHAYNQMNGLVPAKAAALCTIADYVVMRLTNRSTPISDATNAASLGLFDLKALQFDPACLNACRIDPAFLPVVMPSGTVAGQTAHGIPVYCALGDNQASFLGSVQDVRGTLLVNIGTGSQLSAYSDDYRTVEELDVRPFPGGGYLFVGASLSGGKSYAQLEQFFREVCSLFAGIGFEAGSLYEMMNRLAEEPIDANRSRLRVNTQFYGTRQDPQQRGSIVDLDPVNWTPGQLVHGFLDGILGELRGFYDALPECNKERIRMLAASGNGVRSNPALLRKLGQVFALPPVIPSCREEASCGAALCAAVGSGLYPDFVHL